jgi:DNA gyrase subunit A
LSVYQAQNRGGKGILGARTDEEDPIEHLFVASTHAWLLFFTDYGKVYWQKVYDLPLQGRTAKGRALVNLLSLSEGERVTQCLAVQEFDEDHYLLMATRQGTVKKTVLSAYARPLRGGLIAIKLDDGDRLIDVRIVSADDDVVLATRKGMAIRFTEADARAMGRATHGVKGITLVGDDAVVGMVVARPGLELLTATENGYGKRTPFGSGDAAAEGEDDADAGEPEAEAEPEAGEAADAADAPASDATAPEGEPTSDAETDGAPAYRGNMQYRRQRRGGKGLRDIRTSARNGLVVDVLDVSSDDEVLMVTALGKIQRIRAADISRVGRNTQGVRIIRLDEGDKLVSMAQIPGEVLE